MFKPYGVIPALPTPMKEGGVIDYDGLAQLIEHVIKNGVHGVLVGGSTGEYSLMSLEERQQVIQFVCDTVDARVPVMAGTGCHSTEDTIKLTQFAEEAGVSSALVINPYYMATSDEGILNHYKAVTENSKIGIVIYHYPDATGIELSPELIHEISQLDGIVGIKNTADGVHTSKLLNLTKDNDRFSLLTGFEDLILATLASGGVGAIGVVHNLVPDKIVKLYDLIVKENNIKEAAELNKELIPLYNLIEEEVIPGTVKAGLEAIGLPGGPSRSPLVSASPEFKEKIASKLNELYQNS
ncbi:4-hydroxy-tetrahydrodipicolinate synthase [Mammaliicoccus sciuri]|uniref:4-hydroxy-tetrahydrodipicolinate synthase n=1 Tax=Mammaliicoccus TaxID=2803850 RepID=UPI0009939776|nr:4-hydroxy-tetrahydrodipicolinate synthase [Mammaliicoccus sciuri]OOV38254.1 4-hydroxy-tetrahydrodipicolinate synthase [Staphylococcus sp. MB371]MBO3078885.1 4-hydroxy-tetrahydrodipicolinate synthase [Mammaliicoccus sciuri]MBV5105945.1 4-hydroxy-tetrahydrodipicolinate synthase [Mammaliicoccus sciuri]MCD8777616.1 4-hydroxy-tetrahydrodipicolinate synthase [Mammaliicoccus sciuri]MCD8780071.1 4-hydroxy-tetrahydrodipicolinate synthase [Mammaliicoccus sciuri]